LQLFYYIYRMEEIEPLTKKFKTVQEYASMNFISVQAVYKRIKSGKLKARKLGKLTLIDLN